MRLSIGMASGPLGEGLLGSPGAMQYQCVCSDIPAQTGLLLAAFTALAVDVPFNRRLCCTRAPVIVYPSVARVLNALYCWQGCWATPGDCAPAIHLRWSAQPAHRC